MPLRFPDLQVLFPRSFEVARIAGAATHQEVDEQRMRARQFLAEVERRQRQVRARAGDMAIRDREAGGRGQAPPRRNAAGGGGPERADGGPKPVHPAGPVGPLGHEVDLRA